jgi:hypothetical protein
MEDAVMVFHLSVLSDSIFVIAGHSGTGLYDYGESRGGDDGGGIGVVPIVGIVILALVTIGLLVGLDRPGRLKSVAPAALILAAITAPLILWTASSGGDKNSLIVERGINTRGAPELVFSVADGDLNTPNTTKGKRTVRLECIGSQGHVVLNARHVWPFVDERGAVYPHAHQTAGREQVQRAERCRVRGTRIRLEADVQDALRPNRR